VATKFPEVLCCMALFSYVRLDNVKIMSMHVVTCVGCGFSTVVTICFKAISEIRGVCLYLLSKND